ncbi:hypothetical protein TNCV_1509301 [Trichonephila clavipes]|nr:hypothetical protein TNCV_1509301 [Trichonephila clavipes]
MGQTSSVNFFSVTDCISGKYRVYTVELVYGKNLRALPETLVMNIDGTEEEGENKVGLRTEPQDTLLERDEKLLERSDSSSDKSVSQEINSNPGNDSHSSPVPRRLPLVPGTIDDPKISAFLLAQDGQSFDREYHWDQEIYFREESPIAASNSFNLKIPTGKWRYLSMGITAAVMDNTSLILMMLSVFD